MGNHAPLRLLVYHVRAEERKRSALDWAAKLAEEHGHEIFEAFLAAIKGGDWRAADVIMTRVYGKPKETIEHQQSDLDRIDAMTPEERDELRARIAARKAALEQGRRLHAVE